MVGASKKQDYNRWTKEALVQRIQKLEKELCGHRRASGGQKEQQPPAGSSAGSDAPPQVTPAAANGLEEKRHQGQEQQQQQRKQGQQDVPPPPSGQPQSKKRKKGVIDPSKYSTRFIALKLAYLGKNYNGFEYQPSGTLPSVEEMLWKALVKTCLIFPENPDEVDFNVCEYSKCGRTDRGVSAFGQVIALRVRSNRPAAGTARDRRIRPRTESSGGGGGDGADGVDKGAAAPTAAAVDADAPAREQEQGGPGGQAEEQHPSSHDDDTPYPVADELKYCRLLNANLPSDIRVLAWCPNPPPGFSARFSCRQRQYRYFFTQPAFSPSPDFLESPPSSSSSPSPLPKPLKDGWLDIEAMRAAARHFEGLHDFRNFCKIDPSKQISNFTRRVLEADVVEVPAVASTLPYLRGAESRPPKDDLVPAGIGGDDEILPKVYYFHVRGSAFLWHQIRHMVAVLFLVGQGLEQPGVVRELLDVDRHPARPNYTMASDTPLVLWDCLFGRDGTREHEDEGGAEVDCREDGLEWVYIGEDGNSLDLLGRRGLIDVAWEGWRSRKMDELLSNRLLDRITELTEPGRAALRLDSQSHPRRAAPSSRSQQVFQGGDGPKPAGAYVPLTKRPTAPTAEEVNDKWARKKGFASAEEMRNTENWRGVIRARNAGVDDAAGE